MKGGIVMGSPVARHGLVREGECGISVRSARDDSVGSICRKAEVVRKQGPEPESMAGGVGLGLGLGIRRTQVDRGLAAGDYRPSASSPGGLRRWLPLTSCRL